MNTVYPIIGLAGTFASGKDTLAHYLTKERNFMHVSTGDMVRQEAMLQRGSIERSVLHEVADDLRKKYGAGVLVEMAVKTFRAKQDEKPEYSGLVISGMRSLGEAKAIKSAGGKLVFVDADLERRYQRMVSRRRDQEIELTLDQFRDNEQKEFEPSGAGDEAFNLRGIKEIADASITNDGSLDDFLHDSMVALGM